MINIEDLYSMTGKVCVVTGGSTGLGSYMAEGFLAAGAARVYITARSEDTLQAKAAELTGMCQRIPAHRYGGLEDMAGVAVMLCSRAGSYFTGEVPDLDGGHRLRF